VANSRGERDISPSAYKTKSLVSEANISENVELVGATRVYVYDVFVAVHEVTAERSEQDNYTYICAGSTLTILNVSASSDKSQNLTRRYGL